MPTMNNDRCTFTVENGKLLGRIEDRIYEIDTLENEISMKEPVLTRNSYFPDEVTDPLILSARMLKHHLSYIKGSLSNVKDNLKQRKVKK